MANNRVDWLERSVDALLAGTGLERDLSRRESLRLLAQGLVLGVAGPAFLESAAVASAPVGLQDFRGERPGPVEWVFVCYFIGQGKFSDDMRLINLNMTMYDLDGNAIGEQHGVHESLTPIPLLFHVPPTPPGPFDEGPVPVEPVSEWTKGIWTFDGSGSVYAVGPARSQLVPFTDGSLLYRVTTGQTITSGSTGAFAGAYGVKQATGATFIPAVAVGSFPLPGLEFEARTIEAFRIMLPDAPF